MTDDSVVALLYQMKRIRFVELEIARRYSEGKMRCPTHLSVGQEAVAAGVGHALRREDLAVSGHRAHAHYLGKGGDLPRMLAEIFGKVTGCARGKGGSMHLVDQSVGFKGSTAIVAGTVPVGVGLAYAEKLRRNGRVVCVFMGDAVFETGVFFESLNFALLKKLPVLFVCENNLYSVYSPLTVRQPEGREIWRTVAGLGVHSEHVDGNDVGAVYAAALKAIADVRDGHGPRFIEFSTYRWLEHCGPNYDNDIGYRSETEFLEWKAREPIESCLQDLLASGAMSRSDVDAMDTRIHAEVEAAFLFAEQSPFPPAEEARMDLYG